MKKEGLCGSHFYQSYCDSPNKKQYYCNYYIDRFFGTRIFLIPEKFCKPEYFCESEYFCEPEYLDVRELELIQVDPIMSLIQQKIPLIDDLMMSLLHYHFIKKKSEKAFWKKEATNRTFDF